MATLNWHQFMMTSSNGNIFRITGPLWGESTCHWWIPITKASDVEFWCFLWSAPEQTAEQTIETGVIQTLLRSLKYFVYGCGSKWSFVNCIKFIFAWGFITKHTIQAFYLQQGNPTVWYNKNLLFITPTFLSKSHNKHPMANLWIQCMLHHL